MEARRRAEGKTVEITLDLPYRLKKSEEVRFLEETEVETVNKRIEAMQALMADPRQVPEMKLRAAEIKDEYLASLGSFGPRVSALMLRTAMDLRYKKTYPQGERVEMPRKGPENTKPGVWWGELQVILENYPATLDLPVIQAQWLVNTWFDEKVQNGLPADIQMWANTFEAEMERVRVALEGK